MANRSTACDERVPDAWNATDASFPRDFCIHQLFETKAAECPDQPAVVFGETVLSYRELNEHANRLAHHLRGLGVTADVRVGVCLERSAELPIALLAVAKAGGAYVPLEPAQPLERLRFMMQDSQSQLVLTHDRVSAATRTGLSDSADVRPVLDISGFASVAAREPLTNLDLASVGLTPRSLVYVIYTSGSTGRPKGVMVEHAALVNRLTWMQDVFGLHRDDMVLQKTPFGFDVSVWELFWPLLVGSRLALMQPDEHKDPRRVAEVIRAQRVTTIHFVPSMLRAFLAHAPREQCVSLRRVVCSGEVLPAALVRLFKARLPGVSLYNLYGPTEATIDVTWWDCSAELPGDDVPIGRPIANTRIYILDAAGQPVALGGVGELCIGGVGVARGYLNRPQLTAERFVPDHLSDTRDVGARLYKTGDLARWLPDGNLQFLGRQDFQVKIRGFRIELGEIEGRLVEHPAVEAAVVVERASGAGDAGLVAYFTTRPDTVTPGPDALRIHLANVLPDYMVPAAYVALASLPLSSNGKLDRAALPPPDDTAYCRASYTPPVGEVEEHIAETWRQALGVERVGRHDDFFALGGHSLLVPALLEQLERAGVRLEARAFFTAPSVAQLAALAERDDGERRPPASGIAAGCAAVTPEMLPLVRITTPDLARVVATVAGGALNVQDIYPLTPLQEGMLFHHMTARAGDPYLLHAVVRFDTRQRLESYVAALQAVIDRHDVLRTGFVAQGLTEAVQVVWRQARLQVQEVELDPSNGDIAEQLLARFHPRHHRLDITQAPLTRLFVSRDASDGSWVALGLTHHLCSDHTTLELVQQEVRAHVLGKAGELASPVPFRACLAVGSSRTRAEAHERFFRGMLADVVQPTLPFGLADAQGDGSSVAEAHRDLDPELCRRLHDRARALHVSVVALHHVAWAQVLGRASGRDDVVFGTVLFGRLRGGAAVNRAMGLFINTLPVRLKIDETTVAAGVRATHDLLAELIQHEQASLAVAQRCSGVTPPSPLFTAVLNCVYDADPHTAASLGLAAWEGVELLAAEERTNYPLVLNVTRRGDAFRLSVQVETRIDPERVCDFMCAALTELVEALEHAPQTSLHALDVLPRTERQRVLVEWNRSPVGPTREEPEFEFVHQSVERQAMARREGTALTFQGRQLSYGELNARANRLAHYLRKIGVGPEVRVGVCLPRGLELIIALLAVVKAGGVYVPLDPAYPLERLAFMLCDSGASLLLTHAEAVPATRQALASAQESPGGQPAPLLLDMTRDALLWQDESTRDLSPADVGLAPECAMYVIYTSGSSGQAKGVVVTHRNVTRLFSSTRSWFDFDADDVWTLFHSQAFDFSVWEMWGALLHGGRLVVISAEVARSPEEFARELEREGVTVLNQTPSAFKQLARVLTESSQQHRLRYVIFGGEALQVASLKPWYRRFGEHRTKLVNMYGITETTVHVTYRPLALNDTERVAASPIGRPIPDLRIYVLDAHGRPSPVGVVGELYVSGAGVARGYLNRPELTSQRFLPDPFHGGAARMYRTGDLGSWLPDGTLEYAGRNDRQVKIRGFRIELGEIEARLLDHPGVREAVVLATGELAEDQRLVAYYVANAEVADHEPKTDAETLRVHLSSCLPEYMVPAAYVPISAIPLTANGKLNVSALPAPSSEAFAAEAYEPPVGEIEALLARLWCELLKVERVGRQDNFFELGGHSLLVVALIERLHREGLQIGVRAVFAAQSLAALAATVGGSERLVQVPPNLIPAACPLITPDMLPLVKLQQHEIETVASAIPGGMPNIQDIYPLAPLQEGILFHYLVKRAGDPYLLPVLMRFADRQRLDRYLDALRAVVSRHDILRTAVLWEGLPEPVQVVLRRVTLPVEEVRLDPTAGDFAQQLYARFDPRSHRIDIRQAPMLRVVIAPDGAGGWLALELTHHLCCDNTAEKAMRAEIQAHLLGCSQDHGEPIPFREFVADAQLRVSRQEHEAFFRRLLGNVDEPTAPFGLLDVQGGDQSAIEEGSLDLGEALTQRVRQCARALGVSAASLHHLAWANVLARLTGREDVVFGTVLFGRMHGRKGSTKALGMFVNTLPVCIRVDDVAVQDSVKQTHRLLTQLLHHEHAPLALAQRCSGVEPPLPLFTSLLNCRHAVDEEALSPGALAEAARAWEGIEVLRIEEWTNYPIALSVDEMGKTFKLLVQVRRPIDPGRLCQYMYTAIEGLVTALESGSSMPLSLVEALPVTERQRMLVEWNDTASSAEPSCVHEMLERVARAAPDAVALVDEQQEVTYGELNQRANQLANYLRRRNVGPESVVALCVDRSAQMIVAILAILKAGGAYLPIDPELPRSRVEFMLADSAAVAVVTQTEHRALVAGATPLVDLSTEGDQIALESLQPPPVRSGPKALAYVIYTSGSTGTPKGVLLEHGGLGNLASEQIRILDVGPGSRVLQLAPASFDASVSEIMMALCSGATLVLARRQEVLDPRALPELCRKHAVNVATIPPSLLALLEPQAFPQLRTVIVAGEVCPASVARRWLPGRRFFNAYGPTEATVCASMVECREDCLPPIIGRPLANTKTFIVDQAFRPVPLGVAGELLIGGVGVARGYVNRPELTEARFVTDPLGADPGTTGRVYRTGDLARYLPDGNIEFLGRSDFQVKLRGFRIELSEIEAHILKYRGIREAVVLLREDTTGDKRLVAYVTTASAEETVDDLEHSLRRHLSEVLPAYMVPTAVVRMQALPQTPNGKLDRGALPAPSANAATSSAYEPPLGDVETKLAELWAEVLKLQRVGRHDTFFELGGHSLLAVRLLERMRRERMDVDVGALFAAPTVAALAATLETVSEVTL